MTKLNFTDPNDVILGDNHPFKDLGNGIPAFQDIRSYVQLTMHPKNSNYIEILDGRVVGNSSVGSGEEIVLTGYHSVSASKKDKEYNYYSTNYTEDNYKNKNGESEFEGFGIKDVDITFDANKIPQVAITFYDVRGNVLNDFNSRFAKMFQLPYPIFELKIKGGFGPVITYRLQKLRDDISIDGSGNYTISSKFIGDRFAPLSDLPLNYLQAVPYLDNQTVNVSDNIVTSFHELMINAKRLYEKLNQEINSDNEIKSQTDLTKLTENLSSLQAIIKSFSIPEIISGITGSEGFNDFNDTSKGNIINYLNLITIQDNNKIIFKQYTPVKTPLQPTFALTTTEYNFISDVITKQVISKNSAIQSQGYGSDLIDFSSTTDTIIIGVGEAKIPVSIDYTKLEKQINDITGQITNKAIDSAAKLTTKLSRLVKDNLGGKRLTIGDIFSLIFQDYNKLMNKIFDAGKRGFAQGAQLKNREKYDKIGFPTVVENGKLIYPGASSRIEFKDWPEVKLIEDFINAFVKSQINNLLTDLVLSKNEDGSSKYIPINGREVYKLINNAADKASEPPNVYVSKTPPEICQLIYERFLILTNINLDITAKESDYSKWTNETNESNFFQKWVVELFNTGLENTETQKGIFLSTIAAEARNIAFALMIAAEEDKNYFIELEKQFTGFEYFAANPTQPLSSTRLIVTNQVVNTLQIPTTQLMGIGLGLSNDKNYVTVYNAAPQLITRDTTSTSPDIITAYMLGIHELNTEYKITKDNLFYIEDNKSVDNKTDFIYENPYKELIKKETPDYSYYIQPYVETNRLYNTIFNFKELFDRSKFPCLIQIPQILLIILAKRLNFKSANESQKDVYEIDFSIDSGLVNFKFTIIKGSNFYEYLINLSVILNTPNNIYKYQVINNVNRDVNNNIILETYRINIKNNDGTAIVTTNPDELKKLEEFLFEPVYLSVNSKEFTSPNTPEQKFFDYDKLYAQYLKQLLPKLAQLVKEDKKTLEDKLKNYKNQMQDKDVKLSMYKSFQVIYENYLYGSSPEEFEFDIKTNFQFVDRAYNDISTIGVLDIKTLLSDSQDTNVSLLTAISRLLSDNNYWFYPFQGFLTTTESYDKLFKIDYEQTIKTRPMFVAMYVGGLSSNPITPPNSTLANDGILKDAIPDDFSRKTGSTLNAFKVKYTGTQNQMVFSDFQHSTESLKNTDEGLRIQSEIIGNASNSFAIPKGQSLLTVYQKQSYTSTVKIPFGNMGIQPTQYYYLEFIPIFEGLYIIYNVSHNINSDTQRLETTFKGYRLKKDVNPIITSELVDFIRDNFYTQTLDTIGFPSNKTNLTPQEIQAIELNTPKTFGGWDITSSFLRNDNKTIHGAIDIGTDEGIDITFTYPDVTFVKTAVDAGGYGNYIVLRSKKDKVDFIFAHLQEFSVELLKLKEGNSVPINMILGKTGATGGPRTIQASYFGPHLHFEVREMPWETSKRLSYLPYYKYLILPKKS